MRASAMIPMTVLAAPPATPEFIATPHDTIPNLAWSAGPEDLIIDRDFTLTGFLRKRNVVVMPGGSLNFAPDADARLEAETVQVHEGGRLRFMNQGVRHELQFIDTPIDLVRDPNQYTHGLLVFGEFESLAPFRLSFIRVAVAPRAGDTTITFAHNATGWRIGDKVFIPESHQQVFLKKPSRWEERYVASVSGNVVTLTEPLLYDHPGSSDGMFLPHVGNLTRNIVISSENPSGVRGHVAFYHHAHVTAMDTEFRSLGRTKIDAKPPIGRYSFHLHHVHHPPVVHGNSVHDVLPLNPHRWGIAIHDTHFGTISNNVVYNVGGSGIITEDGSETKNVIEDNFCCRIYGNGDRAGAGNEGVGFYFRGPNNYVRNNVAANCYGTIREAPFGFKYYFVYADKLRFPLFPGADTTVKGEYLAGGAYDLPILEFNNNESYASENGLTFWWVSMYGSGYPRNAGPSTLKNFKAWNHGLYGIYQYECKDVTIDGFVYRANGDVSTAGMTQGDYVAINFIVQNADIRGANIGILTTSDIRLGNPMIVRDSTFGCKQTAIYCRTPYTSAATCQALKPRHIRLERITNLSGKAVEMWYRPSVSNLIMVDRVDVVDMNSGGQTWSGRVGYTEQRPDWVMPQTIMHTNGQPILKASPESGWTNQQNYNAYRICLAGEIAPPTATTRPDVRGLVW